MIVARVVIMVVAGVIEAEEGRANVRSVHKARGGGRRLLQPLLQPVHTLPHTWTVGCLGQVH